MPGTTLVIVESPAKAKKISGYLGSDYVVMASVGHIRDLAAKASQLPVEDRKKPWAKLAVNVDEDFQPYYVVHEAKKPVIRDLKAALKNADAVLLATDEDREGEAISWHLLEVLKPKVPVHRMVFNEITEEAIREAVLNPREVDMRLVDAQETRRLVDRLYGYPVSEVLWKKIGRDAKSAGRVQSVAVRLVVDRERERMAFTSAGYWDVIGTFNPEGFEAKLVQLDGVRVAQSQDFGPDGKSKKADLTILDQSTAEALAADLQSKAFTVRSVLEKAGTKKPKPPFRTSTLQQEASGRFRWGAQRTMRVAQGLYENGYITYMRTDSQNLSEQAVTAARSQAKQMFGAQYVADAPRRWGGSVKNAQEAHEAIRPAGDQFRTPDQVRAELNPDEFALYDLIWRRTVASQMTDARVATTTIKLGAVTSESKDVEFSASGTVIVFPGFLAALKDIATKEDESSTELPNLSEGQSVEPIALIPAGHTTKPPARFTEASLVKKLEELGIGRPSTYASIMSTIVDRGYVWKKGSALVPSFVAFAVVRLLEEHFADLVDYNFTARMEEILDLIAAGEADRIEQLAAFWRGGKSVNGDFAGIKALTEDLGAIDARGIATMPISGTDAVLRVGRYGAYVERGEEERANIPLDMAPDELTAERAEELLAQPSGDRDLGVHPDTGLAITAKTGRYGPYVAEAMPEGAAKSAKPRTASLLSLMSLDTVTLDDAVRLLALPRLVGADPADGEEIQAQNGRYGPYLTKGTDSRTLAHEDQIFTCTLDQALALFAEPKQRRGRGQAKPPLREVGNDPMSGKLILVKEGRFGPYVTDGETNASLRTVDDPATVSLERASDLIAERRSKGPAEKPKRVAKKTAKKTTKKSAKKTAKKTVKKVAAPAAGDPESRAS